MPKDNNRLDLSADLDRLSGDFLKDVEAAAKEVKERKRADAEKDRRNVIRKKDKRTSTIIIAAATVVLVLVAYFAVFAKQPEGTGPVAVTVPQRLNPPMATTSRSATGTPQRGTVRLKPPTNTVTSQQPQTPPNEYEPEPM